MTKAGVGGRQKAAPSLLGSIFPEAELSSHEEPIIRMDSGADRPAGAVEAALAPTHNLLQVALINLITDQSGFPAVCVLHLDHFDTSNIKGAG